MPQNLRPIIANHASVKQFPSGNIAIKVVSYDPDLVSLVRSIAKAHDGRFNPQYETWNVPRWAAGMVRQQLRDHAAKLYLSLGLAQ